MRDVTQLIAKRSVGRVIVKRPVGPTPQVDDSALVIAPGDPSLTDPFLLMAEDWFSKPGFDWHPHRGLETVTTVLGGVLEHGDNLGNSGALQPGDVQWMTAGGGIIHRELAYRDEHAHTLQMWLNLPASEKMAETRYQDLLVAQRPRIERPGVVIDVVSGTVEGITGLALNHVAIQGSIVSLDPFVAFDYELPSTDRAFVYVLSGSADVAGRAVSAGSTAWSDPVSDGDARSTLRIEGLDRERQTTAMIYSGKPLREPVAFGGPFVMNRREEIAQAFADFYAGKFGEVPRQARLRYDR